MNGSKAKRELWLAPIKKVWEMSASKEARRIIEPVLWGVFALMLSGTEAMMGVMPFGIAVLCAATGFASSSAALCGAVLGMGGVGIYGVWQIFVCVAVYLFRLAASIIMSGKKLSIKKVFCEKAYLRLLASASASIAAGAITVVYGVNMYVDIFSAVMGFALYPAFTYAFYLVNSKTANQHLRIAGLCGVLHAVTLTLDSWHTPFNAGAVFAFAATVIITYTNGAITGASAGIFSGMAMEAVYAPLYPLVAFTVGLIKPYSASGSVTAAGAVGICWALRAGGFEAMSDLLPELLFSTAVMSPIAKFGTVFNREIFAPPKEIKPPDDISEKNVEKRLGKLSRSLDAISELLINISDKVQRPSPEEAVKICRSAREKYCLGCVHNNICNKNEKAEVNRFFFSLSKRITEYGSAASNLVPARLASRCHNMDSMLEYVNTAAKISGKLAAENCKTRLYASDYKAIASLLRETSCPDSSLWERDTSAEYDIKNSFSDMGVDFTDIAVYGRRSRRIYFRGMSMPNTAGEEDMRLVCQRVLGGKLAPPQFTIDGSVVSAYLYSVPSYKVESGRYSSAGEKEKFSGDTVTSFENDEGMYYTLVSDGMGSGREAALTSGISAVFIEKLLMAGAPMKSALEMLNSFICGGENECFTTVDLMETDLYTGKASFIKSGAAPSFVLRDGKVFRLHSKTVPVGIIRALDAELISFDIKAGDKIIMMSDGVCGSYESCPWLYELLESREVAELSPVQAAKYIGQAAENAMGKADDITVAVINVLRA